MDVTLAWWTALVVVVLALLGLDLVVSARSSRAPTTREATRWVLFYVGAAVLFGVAVTVGFGGEYGGQFYAGWVTEYSLSVDNLFVFMVLMARFAVPAQLQLRVLTIGILLALVLRGILIVVGMAAVTRFSWLFLIFGAFLLWTAWGLVKEAREKGGEEAVEEEVEQESGRAVKLLEKVLPTTKQWHGTQLMARVDGRRVATPMLLVMIAIGMTDVLFALDSIPAIFGLTQESYLVISANAFALLGLRQLYFLVGGLVERLIYLSFGLSLVLAFIGVKLVLHALHENTLPFINGGEHIDGIPEISTGISLTVVVGVLVLTAVASLLVSRRRTAAETAAAPVPVGADQDETDL